MYIAPQTLKQIEGNGQAVSIASRVIIQGDRGLQQSLLKTLTKQTRFGEDKHQEKTRAMAKHRAYCEAHDQPFRIVDVKLKGIYSHSTFENYLRVGGRFLGYLEKQNLDARDIKDAVKKHGIKYLESLENKGLSVYTIGQAKSFMGRITGKEIDFQLPPQHAEDITKGRQVSERFNQFREDLNRELVEIAKATGGRRSDLEKLEVKNFIREKGIVTGVYFEQSKGGRDRFSPILPAHQQAVTKIVNEWERQEREKAFDKVNSMANVHSYRREYARELYDYCEKNSLYREQILDKYKAEGHTMTARDIKTPDYNTNDGRTFNRESLFITSQGLGHNRLDIVPRNYFK